MTIENNRIIIEEKTGDSWKIFVNSSEGSIGRGKQKSQTNEKK